MPRERIQHGKMYVDYQVSDEDSEKFGLRESRPYVPGQFLPDYAVVREEQSLDVSWNRDGEYVQLGIEAPREWWEKFFESYKNSPELPSFSAWTDTLDRRQINHLIKTLRRARDAAYGADE